MDWSKVLENIEGIGESDDAEQDLERPDADDGAGCAEMWEAMQELRDGE